MKNTTLLFTLYLAFIFNQNTDNNIRMGIFDKIFGKSDSSKIENRVNFNQEMEKTSEMLDEKLFWNIIEKSLNNSTNQEEQEQVLVKEIEKLTPKQMIGFRLRTDKLLYDTYNSEMWCAGYIMNGGCSDDGFEYFRNWVISRGENVYFQAKENPDSLIAEFVEGEEFYDFESFWYVANTAFKNKTGKDLYDFIADDFKTNEQNYPQFEFTWKEEEPNTMKLICPQLFAKMWN